RGRRRRSQRSGKCRSKHGLIPSEPRASARGRTHPSLTVGALIGARGSNDARGRSRRRLMQMHWEVLIIPLIAIGVWVLSTIFKSVEDERQKERLRRGPGSQGGGPRPRRPVTDLDRFLEEARRRRQTAAQPRPEPVQEVRPRPSEQPPPP